MRKLLTGFMILGLLAGASVASADEEAGPRHKVARPALRKKMMARRRAMRGRGPGGMRLLGKNGHITKLLHTMTARLKRARAWIHENIPADKQVELLKILGLARKAHHMKGAAAAAAPAPDATNEAEAVTKAAETAPPAAAPDASSDSAASDAASGSESAAASDSSS